jgi:hypothetical protein
MKKYRASYSLAGILHHHPNSPSCVRQRLIIPIVKARHFFVACFDFSVRNRIFVEISFYNSLVLRAQKRIQGSSARALG